MPQIDIDEINIDDLQQLSTELNDFFAAYNTYQWSYCQGERDYTYIALRADDKLDAVRRRIRNLAIDLGIHAQFLEEYEATRTNSRIAA
jgi:hypothetical protein